MGPCCVEGCEVTSEETFYFEFPTSRLLRRKWLELIPIQGKIPLGTVVCSRHFQEDDYESVRGKVRLKRKVVPSLLLKPKQIILSEIPLPNSPLPLAARPLSPLSPSPLSPSPLSPSPLSPSPLSPSPLTRPSPVSPEKPTDLCDSSTVSVPSPIDAEKMIDDIQKRIAGSINSLMKAQNGVAAGILARNLPAIPPPPPIDHKEDIEDMITNYHIKNKVPNPALLADIVPPDMPLAGWPLDSLPVEFDLLQDDEPIEIDDGRDDEPVFIEVSVDKDANAAGAGSQDCLMLLESVQVDVDPSTLLLAHEDDYYREQEIKAHKKEDPISLLTSSDEDDVILQEPHIDTVEVSDETDEDDMPLVKLVKLNPGTSKKKNLKKKTKIKKPKENEENITWGMYDFYCVQCHFSTKNSTEYNKHISEHSTVLQVCPICSYTSASKSMFSRHTRIHKVERKFKCHLCDYRARHKMSLIYHLKKHDCDISKKDFKCKRCDFKSDSKSKVLEHLSACRDREKKHVCDKCDYATKKKSDLKRHCLRIHPEFSQDSSP